MVYLTDEYESLPVRKKLYIYTDKNSGVSCWNLSGKASGVTFSEALLALCASDGFALNFHSKINIFKYVADRYEKLKKKKFFLHFLKDHKNCNKTNNKTIVEFLRCILSVQSTSKSRSLPPAVYARPCRVLDSVPRHELLLQHHVRRHFLRHSPCPSSMFCP